MKFTAELESHGRTATGFVVPEEVVEALAAGRRPKVRVTLNDHTYRSSIASMGGRMLLGVSADNRAAAGLNAGDVVEVDVEVDTAERTVDVPEPLAAELAADSGAAAFFASLSYSQQRLFAEPVAAARSDDTRRRRVDKALAALREGRKRP